MIIPLSHILLTLPVLIGCLLLFYFTGAGFYYLISKNKTEFPNAHARVFHFLFVGLSLSISIFAIIVTRFKTCLLPLPFLLWLFCRTFNGRLYQVPRKVIE